ncbi:MAG: HIT domain-containing protein [Patescibacteria group bacterium]|nr:HIT domain-containing protein [Patescibacteria group bacterium]MDE2014980.1 HIT domain-containing protein [Patescibacteria group bacterium]MDE2226409.1 HIT domain-containing protein [Patescibacteria group bacterium]
MTDKNCPFCTSPEIKRRKIIENKLAWAFLTHIPVVPGHMLIAPKRHASTVNDLTASEITAIIHLQKKLKTALKRIFKASGFNYAWNEGPVAGQQVDHFHLHILPRKKNDKGVLKYDPREFLYRPRSREPLPEKELSVLASNLRSKIKNY